MFNREKVNTFVSTASKSTAESSVALTATASSGISVRDSRVNKPKIGKESMQMAPIMEDLSLPCMSAENSFSACRTNLEAVTPYGLEIYSYYVGQEFGKRKECHWTFMYGYANGLSIPRQCVADAMEMLLAGIGNLPHGHVGWFWDGVFEGISITFPNKDCQCPPLC